MKPFDTRLFGFNNGIVTILSLIVSLYHVGASKKIITGALIALLIADPATDAYSIGVTLDDEKAAFNAFLYQFVIQFIFLLIVLFSPTTYVSMVASVLFGYGSMLGHGLYTGAPVQESIKTLFGMTFIIGISYLANSILK